MKDLHSTTDSRSASYQTYQHRPQIISLLNLVDKIVFSKDGKNLGNILEIVLDIYSGKICYAILGFMRTPQRVDRLIALPWDALKYDFEREGYILNVDKSRLHFAPSFTEASWPDMSDEEWADSIHGFYGTYMKRSNSMHSAM